MVLGIGTGTVVGIAGGLFHMLNHAIYKACLFLCGGAVEHRTKTADLSKLGGLVKFMPITFVTCLIAALSISGVPPFNGFFSKWMVYQGIIELNSQGDKLWVIWLAAAMFGSALTLASFMKVLHTVFLGKASEGLKKLKILEVNWKLWFPTAILALVCVLFGVFAKELPLRFFIWPAVGFVMPAGEWSPVLATVLILAAFLVGLVIFYIYNFKSLIREEKEAFIGGEKIADVSRLSGVDFYNTIKEMPSLRYLYKKAESKSFDIYEQGRKVTFRISRWLQRLHNGILPTYTAWCLLGMIILFLYLVR